MVIKQQRSLCYVTRTSSIARWKARGRLPIRDSWTFLLALTVETLLADIGRSRRISVRGGSLWAQILGGRGRRPSTIVSIRKVECFLLPHSEDRMILCSFVWTGYQRVTDGQTYRRNCCRYYSALHCKQCGRAVKTRADHFLEVSRHSRLIV